mmetsp:Transcript_51931/g.110357  ORF Transcript_51931/g.110357 Transcript_51931/m.110357 type:complete len:269 (+) Transcript_51931:82-888(+)
MRSQWQPSSRLAVLCIWTSIEAVAACCGVSTSLPEVAGVAIVVIVVVVVVVVLGVVGVVVVVVAVAAAVVVVAPSVEGTAFQKVSAFKGTFAAPSILRLRVRLHLQTFDVVIGQKCLHANPFEPVEDSRLKVQVFDSERLVPHDLQQILIPSLYICGTDIKRFARTVVIQALLLPLRLECRRMRLRDEVDEAETSVALAIDADGKVQEVIRSMVGPFFEEHVLGVADRNVSNHQRRESTLSRVGPHNDVGGARASAFWDLHGIRSCYI